MAERPLEPEVMPEKRASLSDLCQRAHGDGGPVDALQAISTLRARLDEFERQHVAHMVDHGATWAEVADTIGISRQAAHRRFRRLPRRRSSPPPTAQVQQMLVTGVARETVRLAREEAEALGAQAVGTEHLLLALVRSGPEPMARAFAEAGIDEQTLRDCLQPTIIDEGDQSQAEGTFTRYAREVLEGSLREAVERGDGFIAPDHLLLALLGNPAGGAAQTLEAMGIETSSILGSLGTAATLPGGARPSGPPP